MEEKTRIDRINEEKKRLSGIYRGMTLKMKKILEGLIARAAYMRIALEDYEEDLNEKGSVEWFSQSDEQTPYERERPTARLYNTMNKNYQSIMKQLSDVLPEEKEKSAPNPMLSFALERDDPERNGTN